MISVKKLALALLVVLAATFTANAQDARAKFTLTHEVRWENATLPSGNYTISVYYRHSSASDCQLRGWQTNFHHRRSENR